MTSALQDVFVDTAFWVAFVMRRDRHHTEARRLSEEVVGNFITTEAVLLETANALARRAWREAAVELLGRIETNPRTVVVPFSPELWGRGLDLYQARNDKEWNLTDCISFEVMRDANLADALTTDRHFTQAGFRALLFEES